MKLTAVILRTSDVEQSRRFWSDVVGLEVVFESTGFVFLDGDGAQLILSHIDTEVRDDSLTEVVFESEDVRGEFDAMKARGVPFEVELRSLSVRDSQQLLGAHFRDPDGHYGSLTGWVDIE